MGCAYGPFGIPLWETRECREERKAASRSHNQTKQENRLDNRLERDAIDFYNDAWLADQGVDPTSDLVSDLGALLGGITQGALGLYGTPQQQQQQGISTTTALAVGAGLLGVAWLATR